MEQNQESAAKTAPAGEDLTALHTFVICAYGESPYLGECADSLLAQTARSRILITTSTDNDHIRRVAAERGIEVRVSGRKPDIAGDWNYALSQAQTPYVTIAHQDDLYEPAYAQTAVAMMEKRKKPLLFFSDYYELREEGITDKNLNLRIKKLLLLPVAAPFLSGRRAFKRIILSIGNPICCPSVTYARENLPYAMFRTGMKSNIDWQAWAAAADMQGDFVYARTPLMQHRIHRESTTTELIESAGRTQEDLDMLKRFWPEPMARQINRLYRLAERSNRT